jgi:hypothetical protein
LFGNGYLIVHYASDDCLDSGGAVPVYQSVNGTIKYMEYRDRGIAVALALDDDQKVEAIIFTFKPLGPTHSLCSGRRKNK